MAGHSKWANIQHRKGRQDEKRGKIWTRLIREIVVAARQGGGDLGMNPRLRLAVEKAKGANMPADTIKKNIDKATGSLEGISYEEIRYEGYGIGGAAIIVDCMTDNRVRTVAEVRHAFSKYGGNLGTEGSVAFQFKHCGQFVLAPGTPSRLKFSARVCSVIVLPVPVAPEMSPWRFAISGSSTHSVSPRLAIRIGSAMLHCPSKIAV